MDDFSTPIGSILAGGEVSGWLLPIFLVAALIFGLRMKSMARRGLQASQDRSAELSSHLASVDVAALLDNVDAPSQSIAPNTDDFFANTARKNELSQKAQAREPDTEVLLRKSMGASTQAMAFEEEAEPLFEIPTLQDLPRRSPNEPSVSEDASSRVESRLKLVEEKRQADPTYKPSRAEQVARYALTAQRRDGGSAVYLKRGADAGDIRKYKKAAEILGANDLAYILEHSADLVDAAHQAQDAEQWHEYIETADQLSMLFRTANETNRSSGRLAALADAYLSQHS